MTAAWRALAYPQRGGVAVASELEADGSAVGSRAAFDEARRGERFTSRTVPEWLIPMSPAQGRTEPERARSSMRHQSS